MIMKKNKEKEFYRIVVFEKGDLISSISKKEVRLITGIENECYKYINIYEQRYKDVFGHSHTIEKGSTGSQPIDLVHKHFSILDIRND